MKKSEEQKPLSEEQARLAIAGEKCAKAFGIKNKTRKRDVVYKRHYLSWYLRENLPEPLTFKKIGEIVNRDHSNVISAINKHHQLCRYFDYIELTEEVKQFMDLHTGKVEEFNLELSVTLAGKDKEHAYSRITEILEKYGIESKIK